MTPGIVTVMYQCLVSYRYQQLGYQWGLHVNIRSKSDCSGVPPSDFHRLWFYRQLKNERPQSSSSISRSRLKFSLNPVIPTVYTGQSRSRSYNFALAHFLNLEGLFPWVVIFLTSIDPLRSIVTVRREFISFHQNDGIVHFRSFQSLARKTYISHGNDFPSLNFDHGQTYM